MKRLSECNEVDESVRGELLEYLGDTVSNYQEDDIERLLQTSTYDHEQRAEIERRMYDMDKDEAQRVIVDLLNNQLGPDHGNLGNQKQTAKHIKNIAG
jgi:hypothetical protein